VSKVTLTFDNGPTPGVTENVLAELSARRIAAIFFVVAARLRLDGGRELAAQARAAGHIVGNHSLTHQTPLGLAPGRAAAAREINEAQAEIGALAEPERLFRPFGSGGGLDQRLFSSDSIRLLCQGGYTCVLWNSVPHDWDDPEGWVATALRQVERLDHAVVVLHDLPTGAMRLLPVFLEALVEAGHEIVSAVPDTVVPIRAGRIVGALDGLVARGRPEDAEPGNGPL
jgi:peptidoglycan-N-acetylglucosamine deacetylase